MESNDVLRILHERFFEKEQKMRMHVIAMAGILMVGLAGLAQGAFIEQSPVPWWTGSQGNPCTDSNGNQWGAYQVQGAVDTWSSWLAMNWDGGSWVGPNPSGGGRPAYSHADGLMNSGPGFPTETPGLTFKPDTMGNYSWYGSLSCYDWGQNDPTQVTFGKFDGSTNWTQLYQINVVHGGTLDLSSIPQLQNIPLTTGDKLVLIAQSTGYYSYGSVYPENSGIGLAPEPATMSLLGIGLLSLLRRRQ